MAPENKLVAIRILREVNADVPPIDVHFLDFPDQGISELGERGIGEIGLTGIAADAGEKNRSTRLGGRSKDNDSLLATWRYSCAIGMFGDESAPEPRDRARFSCEMCASDKTKPNRISGSRQFRRGGCYTCRGYPDPTAPVSPC
jgi:hypothetical protein